MLALASPLMIGERGSALGDAVVRKIVSDEELEELVAELNHVQIQISLLMDKASVDTTELATLRHKARELDGLVDGRRRKI